MSELETLRQNVAQSREHVARQKQLLADVMAQHNTAMAARAEQLIGLMEAHLASQLRILQRLELEMATIKPGPLT